MLRILVALFCCFNGWFPCGWNLIRKTVAREARFNVRVPTASNPRAAEQPARQGRVVWRLKHGVQAVSAVAFSPGGDCLASGGSDGGIRLWDLRTGKEKHCIQACRKPVGISRLAFSPDGNTLAAVSWAGDDTLSLWDVHTGKLVRRGSTGWSSGNGVLLFTADGKQLLTYGANNQGDLKELYLFDLGKLEKRTIFPIRKGAFGAVLSPDGKFLACNEGGRTAAVYDFARKKFLWEASPVDCLSTGSREIAFSPDSKLLATGSPGRIQLWDVCTRKVRRQWKVFQDHPISLGFTPNGKYLAVHGFRGVYLYDTATGEEQVRWDVQPFMRGHIAVSADGRSIAVGGGSGDVHVLDCEQFSR